MPATGCLSAAFPLRRPMQALMHSPLASSRSHRLSARKVRRRWPVCQYTKEQEAPTDEFAVSDFNAEEEDFYAILGVHHTASEREIKKAYYNSMRHCHPDFADGEEVEDATEICTCLNYVYETLMNPDSRAAYDAITGFSLSAVNPMRDPNQERDHLFVDEVTCIGCYNCANCCPRTFEMEDDFGRARVMRQGVDSEEALDEAIESCPVDAIHRTSAAQLTLLENVMRQLERVDVFVLFNGGGRSIDVFHEAETSWDKRQSRLVRARMAADDAARRQGNNWHGVGWGGAAEGAAGSNMWEQRQAAAQSAGGQADKQRATALAAAQAARRWRDYQRTKRKGGAVALLADSISIQTHNK